MDDREHFDGGICIILPILGIEEVLKGQGVQIIEKMGIGGRKSLKEFLAGGIAVRGVKI